MITQFFNFSNVVDEFMELPSTVFLCSALYWNAVAAPKVFKLGTVIAIKKQEQYAV